MSARGAEMTLQDRLRLLLNRPAAPVRFGDACLVTGAMPNARCGVEDYTARLSLSLAEAGLGHSLLRLPDWSVAGSWRTAALLRKMRPGIVHLQYPTLGYGRSLGPQAIVATGSAPSVVTLHEFSAFGAAKRRSLVAFARRARHIIFTTGIERQHFLSHYPGCRNRTSVIPIGSNIPFCEAAEASDGSIVFFGQLRPARGLEAVIEAARIARHYGHGWRFLILGAALPQYADYLDRLRQETQALPIEWRTDAEDGEVARALASAVIVYLPYPDGVSERRGTLLAALGNGAVVVTTDGRFRPEGIEKAVRFAANPHSAVRLMSMLINDPDARVALREGGRRYARRSDWAEIAARHIQLYRQLGLPISISTPREEAAE